jgi:hypothetical protein
MRTVDCPNPAKSFESEQGQPKLWPNLSKENAWISFDSQVGTWPFDPFPVR